MVVDIIALCLLYDGFEHPLDWISSLVFFAKPSSMADSDSRRKRRTKRSNSRLETKKYKVYHRTGDWVGAAIDILAVDRIK